MSITRSAMFVCILVAAAIGCRRSDDRNRTTEGTAEQSDTTRTDDTTVRGPVGADTPATGTPGAGVDQGAPPGGAMSGSFDESRQARPGGMPSRGAGGVTG